MNKVIRAVRNAGGVGELPSYDVYLEGKLVGRFFNYTYVQMFIKMLREQTK